MKSQLQSKSEDIDMDRLADTLKGIELTDEGRQPQKELVFVTEDEKSRALEEPVRLAIIKILKKGIPDTITTKTRDDESGDVIIRQREIRRHALSVVEIVKMSNVDKEVETITKNQVYHHLPKLIETGFVIKYGTVTTGKRTTDYYRRTAKGFVIATGVRETHGAVLRRKAIDSVEQMNRVFDLKLTEEDRHSLVDLVVAAFKIEADGRKRIAKMIRGDVVDHDVLKLYDFLVNVYSLGIDEWLRIQREIRRIVFHTG